MGSANFTVSGTDLIATLSSCLLETVTGTMAPGIQEVTAVFSGIDDTHFVLSPSANTQLQIDPEDATVLYNGPEYFSTPSPDDCAGTLTLMAYAADADDPAEGCRGNIRNADITFYDQATLLGSAPVGMIEPNNTLEGIAVTDYSYTLQGNECSAGGKTFQVTATAGEYYTGQTEETTLVTLALPGNESVSGGGHRVLNESNGIVAGTSGSKMNFGFTMRLNPAGKKLQGQVNILFRRQIAGEWHTYQIKSNKINSLAVDLSDPLYRKAIINTKATLQDITDADNPISLGGNLHLYLEAWEHTEEPTGKMDRISVMLTRDSDLLFASAWAGTEPVAQLIDGGKIRVRQGGGTKPQSPGPQSSMEVQKGGVSTDHTALHLSVQPNPFRSQTLIQVETALDQPVTLRIYDGTGRMVRTLYAGRLPAGQYQFTLDAADLPAGVYTCLLATPTNVKTHWIVRVR